MNSAVFIAAVTLLAGRADRKAYIAAMIITGLFVGGCNGLLAQRMKWLAPVLAVPAMFIIQIVFTRPRSISGWIAQALLVLAAVLGATYLQRPLLRVYDAISVAPDAILVAWALAAGSLSSRWALRKQIDRRLHLADRFATRQWALWPVSPST